MLAHFVRISLHQRIEKAGADPGFGHGGGGGQDFLAKGVTYTSEASINQLGGPGGDVSPPIIFLNLEPLRVNLSVFHIFFVTFLLRIFQIFEDNNETINNICKSNRQKVDN